MTTASPDATTPGARLRALRWPALAIFNVLALAHALLFLSGASPSPAQALGAIVAALAAAGLALAAALAGRGRLAPPAGGRGHTTFACISAGFLLGLGVLPFAQTTSASVFHVHSLLTFTVTLIALYRALYDGALPARSARLWIGLALGGAVVITLIRLYGLAHYPFIDLQDEAWVTAWAVNWLRTGHFGDPTLAGLGDAYYAYPRYYLLLAGWIEAFGVGLWQERILGFVLILPAIAFTTLAARNWYGSHAAVLTAAAMFASAVLMSAARVRHDIGLTICVAAALWLHTVAGRRGALALHFASGLVVGLGMFSHYHAAGFGLALLIGLYVPRMIRQRRLIDREMIVFGLGGLAGAAIVVLLQMLPDDLPGWLSTLTRQSKYSEDTRQFAVAFFGNIFNIAWFSVFEFVLVALAVWAALRRRLPQDVSLVLIALISHVALAVMASGAIYYYILPLTPIYGLLIGAQRFSRAALPARLPFRRGELVIFALLLMPLLGATTARPLQAVLQGEPRGLPPPPAVEWVLQNVPRDVPVAGDLYYYFWLSDYPFISHLVAEYPYPDVEARLPTADAIWEEARPEFIIIDPAYVRSYNKFFTPLIESGWLQAHYAPVPDFTDPAGTAVIYRRSG